VRGKRQGKDDGVRRRTPSGGGDQKETEQDALPRARKQQIRDVHTPLACSCDAKADVRPLFHRQELFEVKIRVCSSFAVVDQEPELVCIEAGVPGGVTSCTHHGWPKRKLQRLAERVGNYPVRAGTCLRACGRQRL
jgi:hypothetical protein